jgi:stage II sporulation protein AA (anti-sigma F factor antagonist)
VSGPALELARESESTDAGEVAVLAVSGDLDLSNADELGVAIAREPRQSGLVIDLGAVPFMDSSGLRVLMLASAERDGHLATVVAPDSPVRRVLDLAGLAERIPNFPNRAEAAAAAAAGES